MRGCDLETVQEFLRELSMKPHLHLLVKNPLIYQTGYQSYEQSRQKLGIFGEDEILVSPIFIKEKKNAKIQTIFNTEKQL